MGGEIPVSRAERGGPSSAGADPENVSRFDVRIQMGHVGKDHVHDPPEREPLRSDEEDKRLVAQVALARVWSSEKAILGKAFLGTGVFLRDERPSYGRIDSRLHGGTRPGTARSGLCGRGMSLSRLSVEGDLVNSPAHRPLVTAATELENRAASLPFVSLVSVINLSLL